MRCFVPKKPFSKKQICPKKQICSKKTNKKSFRRIRCGFLSQKSHFWDKKTHLIRRRLFLFFIYLFFFRECLFVRQKDTPSTAKTFFTVSGGYKFQGGQKSPREGPKYLQGGSCPLPLYFPRLCPRPQNIRTANPLPSDSGRPLWTAP